MVTTSMDDYMQTMQQQVKRRNSAENIASKISATLLSNAGEEGAGENSAGLAANNPAQSEEFVSARAQQAESAQQALAAQVFGILENAAAAARGGPPGMAQAAQAAAKQQTHAVVKKAEEQQKSIATMVVQLEYQKEVDKKAEEVNRRLFAATAASTKEISEDVQKSIDDATNVYTTRPKDPSVNVVA